MVAREPGEFGGEYFRLMPEGLIKNYDGLSDQGQLRPRGARPQSQLPVGLAPGARAGRRRRRIRPASPRSRRWSTSSSRTRTSARRSAIHTHSGVILRPMGTESDDDMIAGGPVVDQALQRDRREAHRLSGDQHLARLQVPPEGGDHQRHPGLGLRAPRRAVLGGRDLGPERRGRHRRATSGSTGIASTRSKTTSSSSSGATSSCGGKAHVDWKPFDAPAARPGRDRRLGQDELLAQSAAEPARARGRALSEVDDARSRSRCPSSSCCAPRCARSAPTPGGCESRSANSGWLPAYVSKRALARKVVRGVMFEIAPARGRPLVSLVSGKPRMEGAAARGARAEELAQRLPAAQGRHRRSRRRRVGRARAAGNPARAVGASRPCRGRSGRGHPRLMPGRSRSGGGCRRRTSCRSR